MHVVHERGQVFALYLPSGVFASRRPASFLVILGTNQVSHGGSRIVLYPSIQALEERRIIALRESCHEAVEGLELPTPNCAARENCISKLSGCLVVTAPQRLGRLLRFVGHEL